MVADDFGADPHIDRAIIELAKMGSIPSVAAIVNLSHNRKSIRQLVETDLSIGLHFNISSWPFTGDNLQVPQSPSLERARTEGASTVLNEFIENVPAIYNADYVQSELLIQYRVFVEIFGDPPSFLSVHHDLDRNPWLRRVIQKALPILPGRQQRLIFGEIQKYWSPFKAEEELDDHYFARVAELLITQSQRNENALVAFHPAFDLPSEKFTAYSEARISEFDFLSNVLPKIRREIGRIRGEGK